MLVDVMVALSWRESLHANSWLSLQLSVTNLKLNCMSDIHPGLVQGEGDEMVLMAEVDLLNESALQSRKQLMVAEAK